MSRLISWFIRFPILQGVILIIGLGLWLTALDPELARASGACGHFCADTFTSGPEAVCTVCGCAAGQGFVACAEGVTCGDPGKCVYCCIGCVPPPGAPPGANGCWTPPKCTDFNPPTLSDVRWQPNYPVVAGQKADSQLRVLFSAAGGLSRSCPAAPAAALTRVQVLRVDLTPGSAAWIVNELSRAYPGARVKGLYPLAPTPATVVIGLNTDHANARLSFPPLDPGWYDVLVAAVQEDGQTVQHTYRVPAYVLGSTLIR